MDIKYVRDPNDFTDNPSLLVRAGDFIFVGGQTAAHPVHGLPEEAKLLPRMPWHGSSIQKQLNYLYGNLDGVLKKVGSSQAWTKRGRSFFHRSFPAASSFRCRWLSPPRQNRIPASLTTPPPSIGKWSTSTRTLRLYVKQQAHLLSIWSRGGCTIWISKTCPLPNRSGFDISRLGRHFEPASRRCGDTDVSNLHFSRMLPGWYLNDRYYYSTDLPGCPSYGY